MTCTGPVKHEYITQSVGQAWMNQTRDTSITTIVNYALHIYELKESY